MPIDDRGGRPARVRAGGGSRTNAILGWAKDGAIELRFRYNERDIQAVRAIAGRRWLPGRRTWVLPDTAVVRTELGRAFGPRLVITEAPSGPHDARSGAPGSPTSPKDLLDAVRVSIRAREYSPRTEQAYVDWARRFLDFHKASPQTACATLDPARGRAFLEHLATDSRVGAKTRNQAASALAFFFREVLGQDGFDSVPRAKEPRRLPTVLSHREVLRVLRALRGRHRLIVSLLYSAGLRLHECLWIRVRDVDFELRQILIRDGKGKKDRYVPLAERVTSALRTRVARRQQLHERDRVNGHCWTPLPGALDRKEPSAGCELGWQFLFASRAVRTDPATGRAGRPALHPSAVQREVKRAARAAGIDKRVTCHTFRHSFATEALRGGCDIRTLQHVLGHEDVRTTMIYLHVVEQTGLYIRSPLDRPDEPGVEGHDADRADPPGQPVIEDPTLTGS